MDAEVVIRPFGIDGASMGMTRSEMIDRIESISQGMDSLIQFQTQITFGWLVVAYLAASKLTRPQFLTGCFFYSVLTLWNYMSLYFGYNAIGVWHDRAGLIATPNAILDDPLLYKVFFSISTDYVASALYLGLFLATLWFATSCRRSQRQEFGS